MEIFSTLFQQDPFSAFQNQNNNQNNNQQNNSSSSGNPPASQHSIESLPTVIVTADDLLEESNQECLICLETQLLGTPACKLPCGHLFHRLCVTEWLNKHCTCPSCRFELETSDEKYEKERKLRMKQRKLRYRKDELMSKSLSKLREMAKDFSVDLRSCVDKRDVIEKLIQSGMITITEGAPNVQVTHEEFHKMNVTELKHLLLSFGITHEGVLEKNELRNKLLDSGRVILKNVPNSESDTNSSSVPMSTPTHVESSYIPPCYEDQYHSQPLSILRNICKTNHIDTSGCIDKEEVIQRIRAYKQSHPDRIKESLHYSHEEFDAIPIQKLRKIFTDFGLKDPYLGSMDSFELKSKLIESGAVKLSSVNTKMMNSEEEEEPYEMEIDYEDKREIHDWKDAQESNFMTSSSSKRDDDQPSDPPWDGGHNRKMTSQAWYVCGEDETDEQIDRELDNHRFSSSQSKSSGPYNQSNAMDHKTNSEYKDQDEMSSSSNRLHLSKDLLDMMSIGEIKSILDAYDIDHRGCLEKSDMITRLENSSHIYVS